MVVHFSDDASLEVLLGKSQAQGVEVEGDGTVGPHLVHEHTNRGVQTKPMGRGARGMGLVIDGGSLTKCRGEWEMCPKLEEHGRAGGSDGAELAMDRPRDTPLVLHAPRHGPQRFRA